MSTSLKSKSQRLPAHYTSYVQVLNVDNQTASPSVLLWFDHERFLFNVGEGMQRHMREYKIRFNKVHHMFFTRISLDATAGLPGLMLSQVTRDDAAGLVEPAVSAHLYGPRGLQQYVDAFRPYANTFGLDVHEVAAAAAAAAPAPDAAPAKLYESQYVSITPVLAQPQSAAGSPAAANGAGGGAEDAAAEAAAGAEPDAKRQKLVHPATGAAADAGVGAAPGAQPQRERARPGAACAPAAAVSYVCQLAGIPGKLDPRKAAALGVPRGPLLGELQRGTPVLSVSGRMVHPHEVMDPPATPGPCLLVVDCPSASHLEPLRTAPLLQQLAAESAAQPAAPAGGGGGAANGGDGGVSGAPRKVFVLVHLAPGPVSASAEYRGWMESFGPAAQHLVASSEGQRSTTTRRAATLQAQLHALAPQVFPLGRFAPAKAAGGDAADAAADAAGSGGGGGGGEAGGGSSEAGGGGTATPGCMVDAQNLTKYTLAPARHQGLDLSEQPAPLHLAAVAQQVLQKRPQVAQLLEAAGSLRAEQPEGAAPGAAAAGGGDAAGAAAAAAPGSVPEALRGIGRAAAEFTLLGTCSACPSHYRNVSAAHLDLPSADAGLLFDCGEDTLGQLERRYGRAGADAKVAALAAVWVSHMHADHHGGLYPLLARRAALLGPAAPPLLVIGPWPLMRALGAHGALLPGQIRFTFLPSSHWADEGTLRARPLPPPVEAAYAEVLRRCRLSELRAFPVVHVSQSFGIKVVAEAGWKLVLSGDTRPCEAVVEAARDATLLVHEATFDDELQDEAIAKRHSTTAEALGVASAAGAYRTLLTHFSTRYPRIPVVTNASEAAVGFARSNVAIGFDLMSVNLADLEWLPRLVPVLDALLSEEQQGYADEDADG